MDNRGAITAACIISLGLCISVSIHSFGDRIQNYFIPEQPRVTAYAPPTAAEVFEMRSKCAARVDVVLLEMEAGARNRMGVALDQFGSSKYDPKTNRCFVHIIGRTRGTKDNSSVQNLYDGQTLEVLAKVERFDDEKNKRLDNAYSFMSGSVFSREDEGEIIAIERDITAIMEDDRKP
jgi:hypothetical protein